MSSLALATGQHTTAAVAGGLSRVSASATEHNAKKEALPDAFGGGILGTRYSGPEAALPTDAGPSDSAGKLGKRFWCIVELHRNQLPFLSLGASEVLSVLC